MRTAPLVDVLIDDVTWACATRARRAEWRQTISELIEEGGFEAAEPDPLRAYVTVHRDGIALALHGPRGQQVGRLELPQAVIAPLLREYMAIITEMLRTGGGPASPRLEALDIAKRLTHDDAAELLQQHFHDVRPDQATARRLFTLLVELTHDTTKLGPLPRSY
ncbi:MAG: UPF0262 family protein [Myxococcales bacterium]|nr:UPF0262 family protein [Myxococcota bacterium]MDW8284267.1 UPF0262 family protein [Myxococcales bacterium]